MPDAPISVAGQVLSLKERGWTAAQIALELKIPPGRVKATLRQANNRSLDSQRLFECREMLIELLGLMRDMRSEQQQRRAQPRMRRVERDLPMKLGAAIERLNGPSQ